MRSVVIRFTSLSLIVFALVIGTESRSYGQQKAGRIQLHPTVMRELNQIARVADGLHQSLVQQDEEQTELSVRDVIHQIDRVRTVAILAKHHERHHLLKILEASRDQLELAQSTYGDERRARLQYAFNQLVNMARIYDLDRSFGIFFCEKDRSAWIQKGLRGRNPFNSLYRKCGTRVPK